jgi:hypothetical protein
MLMSVTTTPMTTPTRKYSSCSGVSVIGATTSEQDLLLLHHPGTEAALRWLVQRTSRHPRPDGARTALPRPVQDAGGSGGPKQVARQEVRRGT